MLLVADEVQEVSCSAVASMCRVTNAWLDGLFFSAVSAVLLGWRDADNNNTPGTGARCIGEAPPDGVGETAKKPLEIPNVQYHKVTFFAIAMCYFIEFFCLQQLEMNI